MKTFECEEQKVLLIKQEIVQMNLETTNNLPDNPHHKEKELTLQRKTEGKMGMPPPPCQIPNIWQVGGGNHQTLAGYGEAE